MTAAQPTPRDDRPASAARGAGVPAHVALVVSKFSGGGAERVVSTLAACWSRAGRRVTVVTLAVPTEGDYPLPAAVERISLGMMQSSGNRMAGLGRALRRAKALRRALLAAAPDAVIAFGDRTNVLSLLATAGTGLPTHVSERTDPREARNALQWRIARRVLYGRAARVIVQTESVATWARRRWRRVAVVPNFVAPAQRQATPGAASGPKVLAAVGRLAPVKGFDLLIDAFSRVAPRHPDWTLVIYGEGPQRGALERQAEALGLRDRVVLAGRVTDPVDRLAAAHAFVLSSRHEGFPNALLEAMSCGLPVVAFDCPSGPAEIVTHGLDGLLVPARDVPRLAEALDGLMSDPGERARLGGAASRSVERFSPERVLEHWAVALSREGEVS